MVSAIELEGVSYAYKQREALKDITLAVPSGTRFALLGPNGSGKTTLFRLLSTLLKPQSGQISVAVLNRTQVEFNADAFRKTILE